MNESKFKEGGQVYYKGKEFTLIKLKTDGKLAEIKDSTSTRTVEVTTLKTVEEYQDRIKNGNYTSHQNWIGP